MRSWSLTLVAVAACGGSPPSTDSPKSDPQPIENTETTIEAPAPKPCPSLEVATVVADLIPPEMEDEQVAVRQCEHGVFGGRSGFFAVGSMGQADDSQSEVGWRIVRIVVDENMTLVARGPEDGAGWMTGVITGELRFVDFDGDGTDEILEVIDESLGEAEPGPTHTVLKVWRVADGELVVALSVILEDLSMYEEAEPACKATYTLADDNRSVRVVVTGGDPNADGATTEGISLEGPYEMPFANCLATGTYEYRLADGAFVGKVVD